MVSNALKFEIILSFNLNHDKANAVYLCLFRQVILNMMKKIKSCFNQVFYPFPIFILFLLFIPIGSYSQEEKKEIPNGTEGDIFVIPPSDSIIPQKKALDWNEFDVGFTTFRMGFGFLYDFVTYAQDDDGKAQMDSADVDLQPDTKVRDLRIMISGRFKTKRTFTWKGGFIYDGAVDKWYVRETGFTIGLPELSGHIFIGRTKEGFSLNKVTNGYAGWTMERQMALDVIPILADGIKYFGYLPKSQIFWNVGAFTNLLSLHESFSKFDWQYALRIGWLPFYSKEENHLLHLGVNFRYGKPTNGEIKLRSKPEADPSPYFIDTGTFPSDHSFHVGTEIYYNSGSLMLGSEVYLHSFSSTSADNPQFFGGEIMASYILTGETRPYNTTGSVYGFISVKKPVFHGGFGAWEVLLRVSTLDLNGGNIEGGKFWRITPMVNWYANKNIRLDLVYGYGILDRFNLTGTTQFFQTRIQLQIL